MAAYLIDDEIIQEDDAKFQASLQALHSQHKRPRCTCCDRLPEMYVARINGYYIVKRMPNSAAEHSPDCASYELPPEVSGLARSLGTAIREDHESGLVDVRVEFSLSSKAGVAPAKATPTIKPTVVAKPSKLSLLGVVHFLWDQSRLNKWVPRMAGKRSWSVVQRCLMQSAQQVKMKGHHLSSILIAPEKSSYGGAHFQELNNRYIEKAKTIAEDKLSGVALIIGEFVAFTQSKFSYRLDLVGCTGPGIYLTAQHVSAIMKRYLEVEQLANSLEGGKLIVIATGAVTKNQSINIRELAMIAVTKDYLPVESIEEARLIEELQRHGKWFTKTLRYDLPHQVPMASAVLTEKDKIPLAMYIVPANSSESFCAGVDNLVTNSQLRAWVWECGKQAKVPSFDQPYAAPMAAAQPAESQAESGESSMAHEDSTEQALEEELHHAE